MDKLHLTPYSFRGRMMSALYICAIIACVISLLFAYCVTYLNVQSEIRLQQQGFAVSLLEMEKRTDLSLADMLYLAQQGDISAVEVSARDGSIPPEIQAILAKERIKLQAQHTPLGQQRTLLLDDGEEVGNKSLAHHHRLAKHRSALGAADVKDITQTRQIT